MHKAWYRELGMLEKNLKYAQENAIRRNDVNGQTKIDDVSNKISMWQEKLPVRPMPCHDCVQNSQNKQPTAKKDPYVYQAQLVQDVVTENIKNNVSFYVLNHKSPFIRKTMVFSLYRDICNHSMEIENMPKMIIATSTTKILSWIQALKEDFDRLGIVIMQARCAETLRLCENYPYRVIVTSNTALEEVYSNVSTPGDDGSGAIVSFPFNTENGLFVVDEADKMCVSSNFPGQGHHLLAQSSSKRILLTLPNKNPTAEYLKSLCFLGNIPPLHGVDLQRLDNWTHVTNNAQKSALRTFCKSCILTPPTPYASVAPPAVNHDDASVQATRAAEHDARYRYDLDRMRENVQQDISEDIASGDLHTATGYYAYRSSLTETECESDDASSKASDSGSDDSDSHSSNSQTDDKGASSAPKQIRILLVNNSVETRFFNLSRSYTILTPKFMKALVKLPVKSEIYVNMQIGAPSDIFRGFDDFKFKDADIMNSQIEASSTYKQFDAWLETVYRNHDVTTRNTGYDLAQIDYTIHVEYFKTQTVFLQVDLPPGQGSRKYVVDTEKFPLPRDIDRGISENGRHAEYLVNVGPNGLDNILPVSILSLVDQKSQTWDKFCEWVAIVTNPVQQLSVVKPIWWDTHIHVQMSVEAGRSCSPYPQDAMQPIYLKLYDPRCRTMSPEPAP